MIKNTNVRIAITITKKQNQWLQDFCKSHNLTPSKYISWMLVRKAEEMITLLKLKEDHEKTLEELIRIAHINIYEDE